MSDAKTGIPRPGNWARLVLVAILLGAGVWSVLGHSNTNVEAGDRKVAQTVANLLQTEHLSRQQLNDRMSQRGLKNFIKGLDRMKVYFYQSDIDEFDEHRNELDQMISRGDLSFGRTVFDRFLKRVHERVTMVEEILKEEMDFTVNEELVLDVDMRQFPNNEKEARDRWRKRIKHDLLVLKLDKTEGEKARERLQRRYRSFAARMQQTTEDELLEIFLTSVTTSFDPHTTYMSPSTLDNFRILMRLNLEGIGAALRLEDGYTVVSKIIPGGAADKHGKLKVGDRIVAVGQGTSGETVETIDMKLSNVVKMIRGKKGTKVRLRVLPEAGGESKTHLITRARVELTDSEARGKILERGKKSDGSPYRLGVIDLPSFYMDMEAAQRGLTDYKSTTRDVLKILDDFKAKKVDTIVLDLRRNGGGSLSEAISLTGLFIEFGPVVQVKDADGAVRYYNDVDRKMQWDGPLVVVTSKFSASASEIFAGAIQDYRRGLIIGDESTHGKGTVQSLLDLGTKVLAIRNAPNLGALKLTMQQFYRPNGASTQKKGVLSDIVLPSIVNHMDVGEADLDYAIEFDRVEPAKYFDYQMLGEAVIKDLRSSSSARRKESEEFKKLGRQIARYREQKRRKYVTLNEKQYFARRTELSAEKEEEKRIEEQANASDEIFRDSFYNREVVAITLDYLKRLGTNSKAKAKIKK